MQKRRSRDRNLKKPRKPAIRQLLAKAGTKRAVSTEGWLAKPVKSFRPKERKKPATLDEKLNAISGLALKAGYISFGPSGFTSLMQCRRSPTIKILESTYQTVSERKTGFLQALGGKDTINRWRLEANKWLEGIGRPELKLSLEEALELALGVIH